LAMNGTVTFTELPRAIQIQLAAIGPLLFGLVCGFVLELSAVAYWVTSALSMFGGLVGGAEHGTLRPAVLRGTIAGACFGAGIVIANAASDRPALAPLPSPTAALILITATAGGALAAAGAVLSKRRRQPPKSPCP
jgi:hypothetical protein